MSFIAAQQDLPYAEHAFGIAESSSENVEDTIRQYTEMLGPIAHMRQVHGNRVVYAGAPGLYEEADAIFTDHTDLWLAIKTADCVPVLISTPAAVAAVHCGWRGLKKEILPGTINKLMEEFQVGPTEIYLHIGPCIRQENYEVDESFQEDFDEEFFKPSEKRGKLLFNMPAIVRRQAMDMGVNDLNIHDCGLCTFEEQELFHSYRRARKKNEEGYRVQLSLVKRAAE